MKEGKLKRPFDVLIALAVGAIGFCIAGCSKDYHAEINASSATRWAAMLPVDSDDRITIEGQGDMDIDIGDDAPVCVTLIQRTPLTSDPPLVRIVGKGVLFFPDDTGDWTGVGTDGAPVTVCK